MHKAKRRSGGISKDVLPPPEPLQQPEPMEVDNDDLNLSDDEEGGTRIGDIYIPPPVKPYCSTESVGPRLIITHISNYNFKSYAGDVYLGPFFNRFHAIVGPNGSGKSNVIDSMLFVFGYRANKIRCKKLSVLLHNSAKYNATNCRVAVHFAQIIDKPDGSHEKVPNSEFFISRSAFKDNSSFYTINDKRVHFKEVSKLLKGYNVDLDHNRFLILQGEVESIAMMKPKALLPAGECGLLEYLEDIIGTSRYKEPLIKINNRVDVLTEERTEKHNRCKMAEREMSDLKQPMEEAVEYLNLENDLSRTNNLQIQKRISEQNKKLEELDTEQKERQDAIKEHDEKYEAIKKARLEKEKIIKDEIANYEKLVKKSEEYEQMLKNAIAKYTEIQVSMDLINKKRKTTKNLLKKEELNLEELKKIPEKNAASIAECEKQIEKLTKQKAGLEETLQKNSESLQAEIQPLIENKEELETKLVDLQKEVDECKSTLAISESELKICKQNETMEKRKLETLRNSIADSKETLTEKQQKCADLQTEIPALQNDIREKEKQLQQNRIDEKAAIAKLRIFQADIQEKTNAMQSMRSKNKVLDALMKQKMEGKIPGVLGRLGDLGGIDAKYDVAISTCCGRLDNIVVDTVNTAQACIEYLKASDIGRATFIALEKVSYLAAKAAQQIQTPENAPRLYDLVRVEDNRVLPAFYFALRDTLVANDLDQGTRIAYGATRYRVVSLNGNLIEISGTMSGGGRSQMRGRMGQKVATKTSASSDLNKSFTTADMNVLQNQALELQNNINYLQEQQGELERDLSKLHQSISQNQKQLKHITIDINGVTKQLPHLEEQMKAQQKIVDETHSDAARVGELEAEIKRKKKLFEKSQASAKNISDQVERVQKNINDITGEKLKSVEKKINDVQKQITKLTKHLSQLKVELSTFERNLKKSEEKIESIKKEIQLAEDKLRSNNEEREQANEDVNELKQRVEKTKEEITSTKSDTSGTNKEITDMQKQENEGKMKRIELEQQLQTVEKKVSDIKGQLPHLHNKLKPLKLHEIPGQTEQDALKTYTEEELATYRLQDLQYKSTLLEEELKSKKPNLSAIPEYYKKREVYTERVNVLEQITNKRNEMRQLYDDVRKKRYTEFMQGFNIITKKLKEMYQMITQGGDAELELVDSMDPFSEGVSFSVRPPKKSWKNISNLSGGEKTLSSLALVFALHYYKPSPLYFMDEIDAALDFRNVSIVANYIKERTKNAQFIIISLRTNMFELADFLTGIFKVNDCTNSLTIQNEVPTSMLPSTQQPQSTQSQAISNSIQVNDFNSLSVTRTSPQLSSTIQQQQEEEMEDQQQQQTQSLDQQELSPRPTNEESENFNLAQSSDSLPEQLLAAEDERLEVMA